VATGFFSSGVLRVAAVSAAMTLAFPLTARAEPEPQPQTCTLQSGGYRTVARIIDGETIALDDGREVRLIGALAPRAGDAAAEPNAWPLETEAIRALTTLVLGQTVKLAFGARRTDRYGRHLAHVFVAQGRSEIWVQGELLVAGAARAYGVPGSFECMTEMLAHERMARAQRRGIWNTALYRMKPARRTGLLMSRRSSFDIVEGVVAEMSPTKSATYLNFGRDWKTDFTARIAKDVLAAHPDLKQALQSIKGKRIAVRGWIERRNGPLIDVRHPDQIEMLDSETGLPPMSSRQALPKPAETASSPPDALGTRREPGQIIEPLDEERPANPATDQPGAVDL